MDYFPENPRGIHAVRVLSGKSGFTLDSLIAAAYDSYLPAFDDLLPPLFGAWDAAPASHKHKAALKEQVAALRDWDRRWSVSSVPTALAVYYGEELGRMMRPGTPGSAMSPRERADTQLAALAAASDTLTSHFGKWQTPWGEINRFQRLVNEIVHPHDDSKPSIPVGFTSSRWGSLASFGASRKPGTKKMYGTSGNSFVAVVEFGPRVTAKAVTAGGESGDVNSKHFNDQAERYATGNLREVYYYPEDLKGHVESEYKPGKR
jgi:acyl-homoserine-lactone acylase